MSRHSVPDWDLDVPSDPMTQIQDGSRCEGSSLERR